MHREPLLLICYLLPYYCTKHNGDDAHQNYISVVTFITSENLRYIPKGRTIGFVGKGMTLLYLWKGLVSGFLVRPSLSFHDKLSYHGAIFRPLRFPNMLAVAEHKIDLLDL